jgi:hypothetical protein
VAEVAELAYVDAPIYRYRLHGNNMNFGVQGERYLKLLQTELPFRRWLLRGGGIDHRLAGIGWRRGAVVTLAKDARKIADVTASWLDELLPVDDASSSLVDPQAENASAAMRARAPSSTRRLADLITSVPPRGVDCCDCAAPRRSGGRCWDPALSRPGARR